MTLFPHHGALPTPACGTCPPRVTLALPCGCHVVVRRDYEGALRVGRVLRPAGHVAHLLAGSLAGMGVA